MNLRLDIKILKLWPKLVDHYTEPTEPPDTRPPPEDTDPTVSPDTIGALNKVNKNLDSINKNMISGYESNDERLDRLAKETQNSNELLSSIKKNTLEDNDTLTDIKTGQANANNLLEKIERNTAPESFIFSATRKQGGLNDIFTDEDIQQIKTEIEEKQTEFNEYIETIKSESSSLFTLDTSIAGGYQEHKIVVKGVEIETGISRFSDFFKLISGAILLVATLTALYILLGKNG